MNQQQQANKAAQADPHVAPNQCVVAVFEDASSADAAVRSLRDSDVSNDHISLVATSVKQQTPEIQEELQFGDEAVKRAAIGAGVGGVLGLLAGATVLAVTGLGMVFAAGPVGAGLAGSVVGAFLGAMRGWGVSEDQLQKYEELVRDGKVLVIVHGGPLETAQAQQQLEQLNAQKVHLHAWTSADSPDVDDRPQA
ncbi:MAG: hypothetical protein RIC55_23675 [Pirellulaceae bacterium]